MVCMYMLKGGVGGGGYCVHVGVGVGWGVHAARLLAPRGAPGTSH